MVLMHTPERDEGFQAPDFTLKNIDGTMVSLKDVMGENGLVVMFICNHCPYVKAITDRIAKTAQALQEEGVGVVAIMSNDTQNYPQDSYENMKIFAKDSKFTFPYLIDKTQQVARAYGAVCTPDFFGFDGDGILHYRGRLDDAANKAANEDTVPELLEAMRAVKQIGSVSGVQHPSMGCSIKWKE
ncbi:MAG: thioredoxin family protein [Alphaproteobacteria bacterium]|nr:thioredoxin family protein [Alphaproteobacteria bacterium]